MIKMQNSSGGESNYTNVVKQEDSVTVEFDMLAVTTINHTDSWILDTSCSFHMTSNKHWFDTYQAGNFGTCSIS